CAARSGDANTAMNNLNTLLRNRYASGTFTNLTASSGDDALNKVLKERRKELLYRGIRWSDLRRLNQESRFQVTLVRNVNGQTYTLPPNDPRYVELIPVDVISNSTMAQNPR
ncbi:MAG: RagB/SusD family nutrient uptake outer membrane protein, partial [Mucilaginibacter sp.]